MRLAAGCLALLFLTPVKAPADTLGEAGAREMRRQAARRADPPSCLNAQAVQDRETTLRSLFGENTVPIPLCYTPGQGRARAIEGKAFVQAEVDEAGTVMQVKVTGVARDSELAAAARDDALRTRFFPVHRHGVAARTTFDYCIVFRGGHE